MAAARRWSKEISDITECPICVETLTVPKGLPCYHTFCLKCLLKYGEHEENDMPGDQVACPLCRANFVIPPGGFADLPNNFFVSKLLLSNQLTDESQTIEKKKCEIAWNTRQQPTQMFIVLSANYTCALNAVTFVTKTKNNS